MWKTAYAVILFYQIRISVSLECSPIIKHTGECLCLQKNGVLPETQAICTYLNLSEFPDISPNQDFNILDLSHNEITSLSVKKWSQNISNFDALTSLLVSYNQISNIDYDFFERFLNLEILNLSYNNLSDFINSKVFFKLNKLKEMDISYNNIKNLPVKIFLPLVNLEKLILNNNPMEKIFSNPMALTEIMNINQNITFLSLNNVGIDRVHSKCWDSFHKLNYISLADNPLQDIPSTKPSLEYLDLSGTNLTTIEKGHLKYPNLKIFKISRMPNLINIESYAFSDLTSLEELEIVDCKKLSKMDDRIFGLLTKSTKLKLKRLNISRNRLRTLNETYLHLFDQLEKADVTFNTWKCDCNILWMKEVINPQIMGFENDLRCASPPGMENKLILDLQPADIPTCYPQIYGKRSHHIALVLLILVVFILISLIIYLCFWSPNWSVKISDRNVAPDSPYSINNENGYM